MTAGQPDRPTAKGVRSLEVRWIFPGQLENAVAGWFGRFPVAMESRQDAYLLDPALGGLSVKIRGGGPLEVKVYRGSPGMLDFPGRARGRIESWQKWSFPCEAPGQEKDAPAGWRLVRKRRRISRVFLAGGPGWADFPRMGGEPGCAVELTEVCMWGEAWWTLGLEATGPASMLRRELEAAAALLFGDTLPGGVEFGAGNSKSYAEWLCGD